MMAFPFLAFFLSLAWAMKGRERLAIALCVVALASSVYMFLQHATDTLSIAL